MDLIMKTIISLILILLISPKKIFACTLLGASSKSTSDGNVYIASTSDNSYLMGPRKPVKLTMPENGYKFIHTPCMTLTEDEGMINQGSDRGMNEKGFSWTRSWVVPKEEEALNKMDAVDWFIKMGSTVASVDEAIDFVKENPKGIGCQGNYIFADAKNNIALVEVSYSTVKVVEKYNAQDESSFLVRANCWKSEEMKALDDSERSNKMYYHSSEDRYNMGVKLLKKHDGEINVEVLKNIITNRESKSFSEEKHDHGINNYGTEAGTVSAEIYNPVQKTFWYTYGWTDDTDAEIDEEIYGKNINSWKGQWIPFEISKMNKEGYYTNWDGGLTNLGIEYLKNLNC